MMVKPTVNELLEKIDDRYKLVVVTSKRARQLSEGALPLTDKEEESMVTLAAQEIAEGKVVIEEDVEDE
jgi:DNA-directed RNA polymerase subunit omega